MMLENVVLLQYRIKSKEGYVFSNGTLNVSDLLGKAFDLIKPLELNEWLSRNIWAQYKWNQTGANNSRADLSMEDLFRFQKITWCELIDEKSAWEMWEQVVEFFNEIAPDGYKFMATGEDGELFGWFKI